MRQVVVFPRGQLTAKDKERLTKAGIIAVEADDPSKVVTLLPTTGLISPDDILMSAFAGLQNAYDTSRGEMVKEMHRRAKEHEKARATGAEHSAGREDKEPPK